MRTPKFELWLKVAPMEAVAPPALGTHCLGTLGKLSGAGEVEAALEAMGVSWTLQSGLSSALQVT